MRDNVPVRTMIDMIIKGSIKGFRLRKPSEPSKDRRKDDRTNNKEYCLLSPLYTSDVIMEIFFIKSQF